jgi:AcrR family transcriptional regulator
MAALTKAMGISRPSLYPAFGNKEALFRKAVERHGGGQAGYTCKAEGETRDSGEDQKSGSEPQRLGALRQLYRAYEA